MATKKKPRRKLSSREVRGQHAAALPAREAMTMVMPDPVVCYPALPFEPIAAEPMPADGGGGDGAGTDSTVYAPANESKAENLNSPGSTQGSSSTQSAPVTQGG
jgi:hypothetical protein